MKKIFIFFLLMVPMIVIGATKVNINGIYYHLSKGDYSARVTRWVGEEYKGNITIPSYVGYQNENYAVYEIEALAFYGCTDLKSISIPHTVKIGAQAFGSCSNLTSVSGISSAREIGQYAFSGCSKLSSDISLYGVSKIEEGIFNGCSSIKRLNIGNAKAIDRSAFGGCYSLESIVINNSNTVYDSREGCNAIIETKSNTLILACNKTFIPSNIESIGIYALLNCNKIDSIIIPNSVKNIKESAFSNCKELKKVICMAENTPYTEDNIFDNSVIENAILYVPAKSINKYREVSPWNLFKNIIAVDNDFIKCATPSISYNKGKLIFNCDTEGIEFKSTITDSDIKSYNDNEINLCLTYNISVYATKTGYEDSEMATATLCWIDAEPTTEGIINDVAQVRAKAVMIQSNGNVVSVSGADRGTEISIYDIAGKKVGSSIATSDITKIATSLDSGSIAIIRIGEKAVKILIK